MFAPMTAPPRERPIQPFREEPREEKIPSPIEAVRPMFVERLQNSRLVEDTNIILECHVSGQPFPEIYWTKDGQPITPDARYVNQFVSFVFIPSPHNAAFWLTIDI